VKIGPLIKARDKRRIAAVEMKYIRKTAAYTWTDYKTNTEIAKKINITEFWTKYRNTEKICYNF
jgi:hypothetical protein